MGDGHNAGQGEDYVSNNSAEFRAALHACQWLQCNMLPHQFATVHPDSLLAAHSAQGRAEAAAHAHLQHRVRCTVMAIQAERQAQGRIVAPTVTWEHVKAHSGHPWNELADSLATQAIREANAYCALYAPPSPRRLMLASEAPPHGGDNAAPGA
eukprot:11913540-Alexandrium_andersonii.AAC.1